MPHDPARRNFLKFTSIVGGTAAFAALAHAAPTAADTPLTRTGPFINALDHGVVADGHTKINDALNRLIERVAAAGGGTISLPAGLYLSGPLVLLSNITLHLDAGAVLTFSDNFEDYLPMVPVRWQGLPVKTFQPLIRAHGAKNIALTGRGEIDGHGARWWAHVEQVRAEARRTGKPPASRWLDAFVAANPAPEGQPQGFESAGFMRPPLFQPVNCENVLVAGLTVRNSPFWTLHFVGCDNVVADGVNIYTPDSPNTDGINPESCRNVRIANCHIDTDDDCVTLKSGKGAWGRQHAGICENITVTNCTMTGGAAGVGLGSEMSGGIRGVTVSNCVFAKTLSGIHLKSNRGRGGVIEDIVFTNLVMRDVGPWPAIYLDLEYWTKTERAPFGEGTPVLRNVQISHIRGTGLNQPVDLKGLAESPMRNISLRHVDLAGTGGFIAKYVEDLRLDHVRIASQTGAPLTITSGSRVQLRAVETTSGTAGEPQIRLHDVQQAVVASSGGFETTRPLVAISGEKSNGIRLLPDNLVTGPSAVTVSPEVKDGAIEQR